MYEKRQKIGCRTFKLSDSVYRIQKRWILVKIFLSLFAERKTGDFRQGENRLAGVIAEMTTEPLIGTIKCSILGAQGSILVAFVCGDDIITTSQT